MMRFFLTTTLIVLAASCGNRAQNGGDESFNNNPQFNGTNGAATTSPTSGEAAPAGPKPCESKADCPKQDMNIDFDSGPNSALNASLKQMQAYVGKDSSWTFTVNPDANGGRQGKVFVEGLPKDGSVDNNGKSEVKVKLESQSKADSNGDEVTIYARDYTRCVMFTDKAKCDKEGFNSEYDTKKELNLVVVKEEELNNVNGGIVNANGDVVQVSDPKCGGFQPTTDGEIKAKGLAQGINIFTGILSGNPAGITQALGGIISSQVSKDDAADPKQC